MATPAQGLIRLSEPRPYHALRLIVEQVGGQMYFERHGRPAGGVWIVRVNGLETAFACRDLNPLYMPRRENPTRNSDYTCTLRPAADQQWLSMIGVAPATRVSG